MTIPLTDWLGENPFWLYLLLALLLFACQLFRRDLTFAGLAAAAFVTALVTLAWPAHWLIGLAIFGVLAGLSYVAVRQIVVRR
jgi:membrane protein implicated in regulation of membrane protease activity